jgi:hypothetical protein
MLFVFVFVFFYFLIFNIFFFIMKFLYFSLQEELLLEHFSDIIKFVKTRACKYLDKDGCQKSE